MKIAYLGMNKISFDGDENRPVDKGDIIDVTEDQYESLIESRYWMDAGDFKKMEKARELRQSKREKEKEKSEGKKPKKDGEKK